MVSGPSGHLSREPCVCLACVRPAKERPGRHSAYEHADASPIAWGYPQHNSLRLSPQANGIFRICDVSRLISDLRTLKDALEQTSPLLYQSAKHLQLHPESQTHTLEGFIDALRSVSDLPHVAPERSAVFDQLHNYLFGDQGLASAFQKDFIFSGDDLASYLNLEGRHDEIRAEWEQEIHDKSVENPAIRCRWEAAHGYSFPEIVVDMPHEIGKLTLVAPALVRQVIWESMKNVIHSPEPFARSESSGRTDVLVEVQRDDCEVIVRFKMLARVSGQLPDKKTNGELMLSLLGTTVAHRYSSDGDRCILETEVRMATVSGLGGLGL